ncbi:hypothetical protein AD948_08130 [Acetobacter senegalensis]|uniref:Uncharacterized protein n=1 Tax=Acetobacter senegalensis TaxID=446692 RepID=A0A149U251_9PROT|nr:hypothetical protein AD948_08130 [Acetobacter senegalensis]
MKLIRDDAQKIFEKFPGSSSVGFVHKLRHRKFARAVYGDEKIKLSFGSLNFGKIEVKKTDRIALEVLPFRLARLCRILCGAIFSGYWETIIEHDCELASDSVPLAH